MEAEQNLERLVEAVELVFVEIDSCNAGGHAIFCGRVAERRKLREVRCGFFELTTPNQNLAGERERADVLGLDHGDVFESAKCAVGIAALTKHCLLYTS